MALYVWITIWVFIVLLMGLRPDSIYDAGIWPEKPKGKVFWCNKTIVTAFVFVTFVLLWFLTGFRSSAIGNDTRNYLYYFKHFSSGLDSASRIEIGYQIFNHLLGKAVHTKHAFLIVMATIMYGGIAVYVFKFSKNPAVSLCLIYSFFFSVFASMFRQGLAMVVALYGYQLLKDGKKIPAALLFLLATSFHTTAIVCFLLFLDFKILENRWLVLGVTLFCAAFSLTGALKAAVGAIVPKYLTYFTGKYASSGWLAITYYLLLYAVFYYLVNRSLDPDRKQDRIVSANFAFLLFITAFGYAVNLFERAGEYFMLIAAAELPNMLYRGKVKNFRLWIFLICLVMLIMFLLVLAFRPGWNHLYPYEFWH